MKIFKTTDPAVFLQMGEDYLLREESLNNLTLGLAERLSKKSARDLERSRAFFVVLQEGEEVLGTAMRTSEERPLAISRMSEACTKALVHELKEQKIILEGCVGPKETVEFFGNLWRPGENNTVMAQGVYECHQGIPPFSYQGPSKGKMVRAKIDDTLAVEAAVKFGLGFIEECFPPHREPFVEARKAVEFYIREEVLFLWQNSHGEYVSMAVRNRESKNAATIGWVFTPKEARGKGFGSLVTYGVTEEILKTKKFANLYTDMSNPTSNSIYQKLGYRKIADSLHLEFLNNQN